MRVKFILLVIFIFIYSDNLQSSGNSTRILSDKQMKELAYNITRIHIIQSLLSSEQKDMKHDNEYLSGKELYSVVYKRCQKIKDLTKEKIDIKVSHIPNEKWKDKFKIFECTTLGRNVITVENGPQVQELPWYERYRIAVSNNGCFYYLSGYPYNNFAELVYDCIKPAYLKEDFNDIIDLILPYAKGIDEKIIDSNNISVYKDINTYITLPEFKQDEEQMSYKMVTMYPVHPTDELIFTKYTFILKKDGRFSFEREKVYSTR